jgi:hypothetical protein
MGYREMTAAETKVSKVKREYFCQKNKIYGAACRKSPGDDFFVLMPDFGIRHAEELNFCCKRAAQKASDFHDLVFPRQNNQEVRITSLLSTL